MDLGGIGGGNQGSDSFKLGCLCICLFNCICLFDCICIRRKRRKDLGGISGGNQGSDSFKPGCQSNGQLEVSQTAPAPIFP